MKNLPIYLILFLSVAATMVGCKPDDEGPDPNDHGWTYNPQPYNLTMPRNFPPATLPADNPLTVEGVKLGRMLFYDPILSGDSTMACASCHKQENAFADPRQFSVGIDGIEGRRHSMPLFNLAYNGNFFWDGRAATLHAQTLLPVEDPVELHASWPNVITKLQAHKDYPKLFYEAFGVEPENLTKEDAGKALEQFLLTLVSAGSKFDRIVKGAEEFSDAEFRGLQLFNDQMGADCFHCHGDGYANQVFMELNPQAQFANNGLDEPATAADFADKGLGEFTGNEADNGKFKIASLRNLGFTAPYMHDGRFQTLEEVIDHYSTGIKKLSPNLDKNRIEFWFNNGVQLTAQEKADLIAFLNTLNDYEFITNPEFSNPFE